MSKEPLNFLYTWKETYDLSFELADVTFTILTEVLAYCKENKIPIQEQTGLWNLVTKAKSICANLEQISSPSFEYSKIMSRRKVTDPYREDENSQGGNRTLKYYTLYVSAN